MRNAFIVCTRNAGETGRFVECSGTKRSRWRTGYLVSRHHFRRRCWAWR